MNPPFLYRGPRFGLREFIPSDWDDVRLIHTDAAVMAARERPLMDEDNTRTFLERAQAAAHTQPRTHYALALVWWATEQVIGECGLTLLADRPTREGFLWYSLRHEYWGQGIMSEAVTQLIAAGFEQWEMRRIFAECSPANIGSARVMAKAGLTYEGEFLMPNRDGELKPRSRWGTDRGKV